MALNDLNRSNDTPIPTLKLLEIEPVNWRRFPPAIDDPTPANPVIGQPRYDSMTDWAGGAEGNDVDIADATASIADASSDRLQPDYAPRTQADRAATMAVDMNDDVGIDYGEFAGGRTRTGTVEPFAPYPTGGLPPPPPTVTAVNPDTAEAGSPDLPITVTGTDFTEASEVMINAEALATIFVSATELTATIPASALATEGIFPISVNNGGTLSNPADFTVSPAP